MHILGLKGMTRRVYTYPTEMGWDAGNLLATLGAYAIAIGGLIFILNVVTSLRRGAVAGNDPWDAATLEWAADSPPRNYNFPNLPVVESRYPLWDPPEKRGKVYGTSFGTSRSRCDQHYGCGACNIASCFRVRAFGHF